MSRGFRAGKWGSCPGRRLSAVFLLTALSIFFAASVAYATMSGTAGFFIAGDAPPVAAAATNWPIAGFSGLEANRAVAAQPTSPGEVQSADPAGPWYLPDAGAVLEVAPQTTVDAAEIFDVDPGPTTERDAALDVAEIALAAAEGNPAFSDRSPRIQSTAALDFVANGLGPTAIARREAGRFGSGFDFSLLRIFLVLLGTVVAGVAVAHWKLT
jgi:hypothetical protein